MLGRMRINMWRTGMCVLRAVDGHGSVLNVHQPMTGQEGVAQLTGECYSVMKRE